MIIKPIKNYYLRRFEVGIGNTSLIGHDVLIGTGNGLNGKAVLVESTSSITIVVTFVAGF